MDFTNPDLNHPISRFLKKFFTALFLCAFNCRRLSDNPIFKVADDTFKELKMLDSL